MGVFDITNPRFNEQISPVPWHFVKSRFHCSSAIRHATLVYQQRFTLGWGVTWHNSLQECKDERIASVGCEKKKIKSNRNSLSLRSCHYCNQGNILYKKNDEEALLFAYSKCKTTCSLKDSEMGFVKEFKYGPRQFNRSDVALFNTKLHAAALGLGNFSTKTPNLS